jgi:hypothetical protein
VPLGSPPRMCQGSKPDSRFDGDSIDVHTPACEQFTRINCGLYAALAHHAVCSGCTPCSKMFKTQVLAICRTLPGSDILLKPLLFSF